MLEDEIGNAQRLVKTDAYQLSIGEIINMYKDKELVINPDFQRLFRWEIGQKSKLIESILLGIPLPSIFVFEKPDSTWELVDGLQRISTLLEFMGLLINADAGRETVPSALVATKYLPSLSNVVWEKSRRITDPPYRMQKELSSSLKLAIRRSRVNVEILKQPSDNNTKYELFQRLNAAGTPANSQELRNCLIIMVNHTYAEFMRDLSSFTPFLNVVSATEGQIEKQKDMEYVSRFLVHTHVDYTSNLDVEEFIDEGVISLANVGETEAAGDTFRHTFTLLNDVAGSDVLRRIQDDEPFGRVSLAAFECLAVGVGRNIEEILAQNDPQGFVRRKIEEFWEDPSIEAFFAPGQRGTTRIQRTIPFGDEWFSA